MMELTIDKCVLVHCDSAAQDAQEYRSNSRAFFYHWQQETPLVACVNGGIKSEYQALPPMGATWWRSVVSQSRYRDKHRAITQAHRVTFRQQKGVPLHREDFDYVDAASQSSSLLWLSNETDWQNAQYRERIRKAFRVEIQNVNEYMDGIAGDGAVGAS